MKPEANHDIDRVRTLNFHFFSHQLPAKESPSTSKVRNKQAKTRQQGSSSKVEKSLHPTIPLLRYNTYLSTILTSKIRLHTKIESETERDRETEREITNTKNERS